MSNEQQFEAGGIIRIGGVDYTLLKESEHQWLLVVAGSLTAMWIEEDALQSLLDGPLSYTAPKPAPREPKVGEPWSWGGNCTATIRACSSGVVAYQYADAGNSICALELAVFLENFTYVGEGG